MSNHVTIYAVDFDGTLCESQWPGIGKPNRKLIEHLIERRKHGAKVILWTCLVNERLQEAIDWCKGYGLEFDAVNDNLPEVIEKYGHNSRKIRANCYIDDLSVDKLKYHLPFHAEPELEYEWVEKYPIGSQWTLMVDGKFECEVEITEHRTREIVARSISDNPKHKYYAVRQKPEWFEDKLFPLEGGTT